MSQAETGVDSDLHEITGETRFRGGDAKVCDQGQTESAADSRSLDRGDDRLLRAKQPYRFEVQGIAAGSSLALIERIVLGAALKVRARAKRLALGGKQNRPACRVVVERLERNRETADQRVVKIVVRRAMDLHRRHMFAAVYFDRYVSVLIHRRATSFFCESKFTNRPSVKVSTAHGARYWHTRRRQKKR